MKKSLRFILATMVAFTSVAAQAQLQFCGTEVSPGRTYTKSDFSQIKSGSFKLSSNGNYLEVNNLTVTNGTYIFSFNGSNDVTIKFVGESHFTITANTTGAFVFSSPSGVRNVLVTGDKAIFENVYNVGGSAFAYGKNCHITIEDCYVKATSGSSNDDYSLVKDINPHVSTTSLVTIKNSTVISNTFYNIKELELLGCNFVTPKSYAYLAPCNSYGGQRLTANGQNVKGFTIMPVSDLQDGDVNHDGRINVSDVTALINLILGIH